MEEDNDKSDLPDCSIADPMSSTVQTGPGKWQVRMFFFSFLIVLPCSSQVYQAYFVLFPDDYQCSNETTLKDMSQISEKCLDDTQCAFILFNKTVMDRTVLHDFHMHCEPSGTPREILAETAFYLGLALGSIGYGIVGDRFGRKKAIISASFHHTVACVVAAALPVGTEPGFQQERFAVFCLVWLVVGSGAIGVVVNAVAYTIEIFSGRFKTIFGLLFQFIWPVGRTLAVVLAFSTRSWKLIMLVTGILGSIMTVLSMFLWENPRWLLVKEREGEEKIKKIAQENKVLCTEISAIEKDDLTKSLFQDQLFLKRLLILFTSWFLHGYVFYGLNFNWNKVTENVYGNIGFAVFVVFFGKSLAFFLAKNGMRVSIGALHFGIGFLFLIMIVCDQFNRDLLWSRT